MADTFKNAFVAPTTTGATLYTCPSDTKAIVKSLQITNIDGANDCWVTLEVYDSSGTTLWTLRYKVDVLADPSTSGGESLEINDIVLEASDYIKLTSENNSDLHAFASILEIT